MEESDQKNRSQVLTIEVEQLDNAALIKLNGELDANTAVEADSTFTSLINSEKLSHLFIDCHQLRYISSAGVGVLLSSLHACRERNIQLIFFGLQTKIINVFTILGIEKIIIQASNREEALKHMADASKSR
jgi:anti-anti-sigma factor